MSLHKEHIEAAIDDLLKAQKQPSLLHSEWLLIDSAIDLLRQLLTT